MVRHQVCAYTKLSMDTIDTQAGVYSLSVVVAASCPERDAVTVFHPHYRESGPAD
jgi:hypothetical protein